jgi:hypothetical protein
MPSIAGTPIGAQNPGAVAAPSYIGALTQFDWLTLGGNDFAGVMQSSMMRGQPVPLAFWQMRQIRGPQTSPQAVPFYLQSRPYSRGADAYAPKFGLVNYNPIGAGVYAPYRIPSIAGPGARYQLGAIWFDVQAIPTGIRMNPTVPIETIDALIKTSHVGAMYATTG